MTCAVFLSMVLHYDRLIPASSLPPTTASPFTCPSDGSFAIPQECGPDYIMCIGGTPYPVVKMFDFVSY